MTNKITIKNLATWIDNLKELAKADTAETMVHWFGQTAGEPLSIVGGWQKMFDKDYSDLFCCSKSHPENVMCVKIVTNDEFGVYCGVDDICIPLEWDDAPEAAAEYFTYEWERLMREHNEEV